MEKDEAKSIILEELKTNRKERKRKKNIYNYVKMIVVWSILIIVFLSIYIIKAKENYISYTEKSDVDYSVALKQNNYFENNALGEDNRYIASLVDHIDAVMNYEFKIDEKSNLSYSYKIMAEVYVKEKSSEEPIYTKEVELLNKDKQTVMDANSVTIKENVSIDYNSYNDLVSLLASDYKLANLENTLDVSLYVSVEGATEKINNRKVVSLSIPLTEKTMTIDINCDMLDTENRIKKSDSEANKKMLIVIAICIIFDAFTIVRLVRYIIGTKTSENEYKTELKRIVNNYRTYIQKLNNDFDMTGYQQLNLDSFVDLLEIRDTVQEPILMMEHKNDKETIFVLPTKNKLVYIFRLGVN